MQLQHVSDITELDQALVILITHSEIVIHQLEQIEPTFLDLCLEYDEQSRQQLLQFSMQLQGLTFIAHTISEVTCWAFTLCKEAGQEIAIDDTEHSAINPFIQPTVTASIGKAVDNTALLVNNLSHFCTRLLSGEHLSSDLSAIKNNLAILVPAFKACYQSVTATH